MIALVGLAWYPRAACVGLPTEDAERLFFEQPAAGKRFCREHCPVIRECREYALAQPAELDGDGVFGALTPTERQRLRACPPAGPGGRPRALSRADAHWAHDQASHYGVSAVAGRLGVTRQTLYRAWHTYNLPKPVCARRGPRRTDPAGWGVAA